MIVRVEAELEISADAASIFDIVNAAEPASAIYARHGPIPGVNELRYLGDAGPKLGALREVRTSDGHTLVEELVAYDRPSHHAYTLRGFSPPFSWLVKDGRADWIFSPIGDGSSTHVHWTYAFQLRSPLVWPIAALFLHTVFNGWMLGCLGRARREVMTSALRL